jgi:hypothetical protein
VLRAGSAHLEELMELAEGGAGVAAEEFAAILAQIDLLYQRAFLLKPADPSFSFCRIMTQLCRQEHIERLVFEGANPRQVRAIRNRRARTYESCLRKMTEVCHTRISIASGTARQSGEWLIWVWANCRRVELEWHFLRLRSARRAYLAGFPVNVAPILRRISLLFEPS